MMILMFTRGLLAATLVALALPSCGGSSPEPAPPEKSAQLPRTPASSSAQASSSSSTGAGAGTAASSAASSATSAPAPSTGSTLVVALGGNDAPGTPGTLEQPLASIAAAALRAQPGDTIVLRGGTYRHAEFGQPYAGRQANQFAQIRDVSGTAAAPITLRAREGERVIIESDVGGLMLRNSHHWVIQGLELVGNAARLTRDQVLALWWDDGSDLSNQVTGRGIALADSHHVTLSQLVIHDFPGAGISNNGGDFITLEDSLIYRNAWWSPGGVHGFANSSPASTDLADITSTKLTMRRNLVFGNQSSMISHVFSKNFVTLDIDEGNGLHMQNNARLFSGGFLVEDNLLAYNGKAGLGLNTADQATVRRNAFYANGQAVIGVGELSLNESRPASVSRNLFHPRADGLSVKDFAKVYAGLADNRYLASAGDSPESAPLAERLPAVFANPAAGDFRSLAPGYGISDAQWRVFSGWLAERQLVMGPAPTVVDEAYKDTLRRQIFATWPERMRHLILVTGAGQNKVCYDYASRNTWPARPQPAVRCPK